MSCARNARSWAAAALAAGVAAGALPASVSATVRVGIGEFPQPSISGRVPSLVVSGGFDSADEANRIVIQDVAGEPNTFRVTDRASPLRAGLACVQLTDNSAQCSGRGIGEIRFYAVFLAGGQDEVQVTSRYLARGGILDGGSGDDVFYTPVVGPADDIIGGPGRDRIDYSHRRAPPDAGVRVFSGFLGSGQFTDGHEGREDRVGADVERVEGTAFADNIAAPNQSVGTSIVGHAGADVLLGTPNADVLVGRESGSQTVAADTLRCGAGADDTAVMDLQDSQVDCENLSIAAIDEGGILSIRTRRARVRRGVVTLRLYCPASSKTRCRGRLSLRSKGRTLGSVRYRLGRGRSAAVRVPVAAEARGTARATAIERDSKGRPKTTVKRLTLR